MKHKVNKKTFYSYYNNFDSARNYMFDKKIYTSCYVKTCKKNKKGLYVRYIKRLQDFVCAFTALLFLSPIMFCIAVLIKFKLGSPVIFKQSRPGLNGNIFTLYKIRTMTDERDKNGNLLSDENRLTEFGKMLRATSLDELPELLNILKGDSGIIGTTKKNLDFTGVSLA